MREITGKFSLAGFAVEIRWPEILPLLPPRRIPAFQATKAHPDIRWVYQIIDPGFMTSSALDPEKGIPGARINRLGDGSLLMRSPQFQARLDQTRDHAHWLAIEMHAGAVTLLDFKKNRSDMFFSPAFAAELAVRGIGSAMLAPFLPSFDACLLHASAIVRHGRTAVFLAADDGGKTTAVCLSPAGAILGDDQVLVRRSRSGFRVSGTPWGLHVNARLQAPLAGLFLIQKADRFALAPLRPREIVPQIWEEIRDPLSILPKPLKKKAFEIICAIAADVPAWRMSFPKDHIDWEAVDRALSKKDHDA